ncbi:MAG: TetR/AcrR family transcriptional regulator [bacterium]|nr:TetR/AcrR family transcriptional regulator [bacterium]
MKKEISIKCIQSVIGSLIEFIYMEDNISNIELRRQRILNATILLLAEKDITKITTREVVKKAGVNISMLHYYFKTKNELFIAAIKESIQDIFKNWSKKNIDFDNPKINDLEKYLGYVIESVYKFPSISKSIIYLNLQEECTEDFSFDMPKDLYTILGKLLDSNECKINEGLHILSQLFISLRVTTSLIENHLSLNFNSESDRITYTKVILCRVFPELYK